MATKDLTLYTETDPNNKLTVTADTVTGANLQHNDTAGVVKDYGADYFNALDTDFTIRRNPSLVNAAGTAWLAADLAHWDLAAATDLIVITDATLYLMRGVFESYDSVGLTVSTTYYLTLSRAAGGGTVTLYVYNDSARTDLKDTLTATGFGTTKWRWHKALIGPAGTTERWDGVVGNFDFNDSTQSQAPRSFHQLVGQGVN